MIESKYRSRKWKAFQFGVLSNIALVIYGAISGAEFVTLQIFIFGFYKAANVMEKKH